MEGEGEEDEEGEEEEEEGRRRRRGGGWRGLAERIRGRQGKRK